MKSDPRILIVITIMVWLLPFSSCQKKEQVTPEPSKVNIVISSPTASYEYRKGDTVHINASVSYVSQMHGYNVRITDKSTNALVYDGEGHVHSDHFDIAEKWLDTVSHKTSLLIEISAVIDHEGNAAKAEVTIQNQP